MATVRLASVMSGLALGVRFGFKTSPHDTSWDGMLAVWRAADDIEVFESGWTSDHFYPMHTADPFGSRLEGWTTLIALAQATRRLRLGTLVTGVHYRHPAVLANMAATPDIISAADWSSASGPAGMNWSPAPMTSGQARPGSAATGSKRPARCSLGCFHVKPPRSRAAITS